MYICTHVYVYMYTHTQTNRALHAHLDTSTYTHTGKKKDFAPIQYPKPDGLLTFDLLSNLQRRYGMKHMYTKSDGHFNFFPMCVYAYIYMYVCVCVYIYIYIYICIYKHTHMS